MVLITTGRTSSSKQDTCVVFGTQALPALKQMVVAMGILTSETCARRFPCAQLCRCIVNATDCWKLDPVCVKLTCVLGNNVETLHWPDGETKMTRPPELATNLEHTQE